MLPLIHLVQLVAERPGSEGTGRLLCKTRDCMRKKGKHHCCKCRSGRAAGCSLREQPWFVTTAPLESAYYGQAPVQIRKAE